MTTTTMTTTAPRPVSAALIASLRGVQANNPIVVWLDRDGHYTELVDELIAGGASSALEDRALDPRSPLLAYRGSYLALMRSLAPLIDGPRPERLIVHVPGADQASIKDTPLLELNEAGYQYRKALPTLVREAATGRVTAEDVDAFLRVHEDRRGPTLTLAEADAWLASKIRGIGGGLGGGPGGASAVDSAHLVLRGHDPGALIIGLLGGPLAEALGDAPIEALDHDLGSRLGLPVAWPSSEVRARIREAGSDVAPRYADLAARWVMSVEFVHDLERDAASDVLEAAKGLAKPLVDACRDAAAYLRRTSRDFYVGVADDFEDQLAKDRGHEAAELLGHIDTFRFEEDHLLQKALEVATEGEWGRAAAWARERLDGDSVWLQIQPERRKTWALIDAAARLSQAIAESTLSYADATLGEAARRYAEQGAAIDRLHRTFEQQAVRALEDAPHRERARSMADAARRRWWRWADAGAREWSDLCAREGALPGSSMQQRTVFAELIRPALELAPDEKVALFLVDAMRFEMAYELVELIGRQPATSVELRPRLAELPTTTAVGMNALAHVRATGTGSGSGRLRPKLDKKRQRILGFETEGAATTSRASREAAYKHAAGSVRWLAPDRLGDDAKALKRKIAQARLVVVHSEKIDKAGENGFGPAEFPRALRELHRAWELLRAVGLRRFVITSDHGFLLRGTADGAIAFGKHYQPSARHAVYPGMLDDGERLGLSLRSLGYEGADEALIVPRGLDVFTLARDRDFVHGGNSPQERVIPVLELRHKRAAGGADQHYRVVVDHQVVGSGANANTHSIRAEVRRADDQTTLALDLEPVTLELRPLDGEDVVVEVLECEDAELEGGLIAATVEREFTVRFRLSSGAEQRVRVELVSGSAKRRVDAGVSTARFDVLKRVAPAPPASDPPPLAPPDPSNSTASDATPDWLDEIEDPGIRKVMAYIGEHGKITEVDLLQLLGGGRKAQRIARKLARQFDDLRQRAPYLMELTTTATGKLYQRISDK